MEPPQDTTSNENTVNVEGDERVSSSSSSTSSSEFQDPLQRNSFQKDNLSRRASNADQDKAEQETRKPDGDGSTLQSPPIQTMERPDNGSGYRIPSCVFQRNKSGAPVEWSTTSNDSLFSIHTGNMSFTGDKYSWLLEAGDMYHLPESDESKSDPESPTPEISTFDVAVANDDVAEVPEKVEEKVEEKMNASASIKDKASTGEDQRNAASRRSNESFAFPVMENQVDRGGGSVKSEKSGLTAVKEKPEQQKKDDEESNEEEAQSPEAGNYFGCNWFGSCMACFTCCPKTDKDDSTASKD